METSDTNKKISVIIAAAGSSSRLGKCGKNISKQFILLDDKPLLIYSLEKFSLLPDVIEIIVVTNDISATGELLKKYDFSSRIKVQLIQGGDLRQDSVYNGFCKAEPMVDLVLIHDVARPLFDIRDVKKCIEEALLSGAAILAVPVIDTLKKGRQVDGKFESGGTLEREGLYLIQTPQVFSHNLLEEAYKVYRDSSIFTDEAGMVELFGKSVNLVMGSRKNIKITYPEDLEIASAILKEMENQCLV